MKRHATGVKGFASVEVGRPRRSKKRCGVGTRNVWDKRAQATVSTISPFDSLKFGADYGSIVRVGEQGDKKVGGGQGKSTGTPLMVKSGDRPSVAGAGWEGAMRQHASDEVHLVTLPHGPDWRERSRGRNERKGP